MKRNMGTADRITRLVIAALVATLYFTNVITGVLSMVLMALAIIFVLTSMTSFCPLYALFGVRTCPEKN